MPFSHLPDVIAPSMVLVTLGFGVAVLCLLNVLISLVEGVTLTLLKWNAFPRSLLASLLVNTISSLAGGVLLIILQDTPPVWILITLLLSILIEGLVLLKLQPTAGRRTWLFSIAANLSSYLIIILPAYLISLRQ